MTIPRHVSQLIAVVAAAGACTSITPTDDPEVSAAGDHIRLYQGRDVEVAINAGYASEHLGDEYLILGASIAGAAKGGLTRVDRSAISIQSPYRHRMGLISQDSFRELYGRFVVAIKRVEDSSPSLLSYRGDRRPCGEWFLTAPAERFPRDALMISALDVCDGVLIFHVPGGTQPGRWELSIELEESVIEIPLILD
jgi:hypothetical protein